MPDGPVLRYGASASASLSVLLASSWLLRFGTRSVRRLGTLPKRRQAVYAGVGYEWNVCEAEGFLAESSVEWDGTRSHPLFLEENLLGQHLLILGTTGTGKTRLLELLILQAIRRGEPVVVVDPKGDERLLKVVRRAAGSRFRRFSLPEPKESFRYNPIGEYVQSREVADRIAATLPSEGEAQSFRNYAWELVDTVVRGLEAAGEPITFSAIREYGIERPWVLAAKVLSQQYPKLPKAREPARAAELYEDLVRRGKIEPDVTLESMIALARRPREHHLKMASSLVPILVRLGRCESLGPGWSWCDAERKREVVYFSLGSLLGAETANAVAKMMLLDFQSFVGRRYFERRIDPFSLFVDEMADVLTPDFVHVLNKSRGAGIRVAGCAQTWSDFEAALSSRARALQLVGNMSSVVQFRAQSIPDAEAFADLSGRRLLRVPSEGEMYEPALFSSGFRGVDDYRAAFSRQSQRQDLPLVAPSVILDLPTFHYFARWGGRVYRGCVPWIDYDDLPHYDGRGDPPSVGNHRP